MDKHALALLGIIYLAFVSLGLPDGALGVAWPYMRSSLHLPLESMGLLVTSLLCLSAFSSVMSGYALARLGTGAVTAVSCALTALGLVGMACAPSLWWLLVCVLPLGLGQGAVDAGLNAHVAKSYSARHMSWLHCFWGVGAATGPLIMTLTLSIAPAASGWRFGYAALAGMQTVLLLALGWSLWVGLWRKGAPQHNNSTHEAHGTLHSISEQSSGVLLFFIYSGIEFSLGSWLPTVLVEGRQMPLALAGVTVSVYYASIMGGRFLTGLLVGRWGCVCMIRLGFSLAALGVLLLWQAHSALPTLAGAMLTGLGLAPLYPCLMHETPRRFAPAVHARLIGWQVGAACLGGSCVTTVMGFVLAKADFALLFAGAVLLLVLMALGNEFLQHRVQSTKKKVGTAAPTFQ